MLCLLLLLIPFCIPEYVDDQEMPISVYPSTYYKADTYVLVHWVYGLAPGGAREEWRLYIRTGDPADPEYMMKLANAYMDEVDFWYRTGQTVQAWFD